MYFDEEILIGSSYLIFSVKCDAERSVCDVDKDWPNRAVGRGLPVQLSYWLLGESFVTCEKIKLLQEKLRWKTQNSQFISFIDALKTYLYFRLPLRSSMVLLLNPCKSTEKSEIPCSSTSLTTVRWVTPISTTRPDGKNSFMSPPFWGLSTPDSTLHAMNIYIYIIGKLYSKIE